MLFTLQTSRTVEAWILMAEQTLRTTWKDSDGLEHTVETERNDGEPVSDFAQRHKDAVDALKALFPPVE